MSSGPLDVLVDANVLFSRTLRDWVLLIHLETDPPMYRLYWTEDILAEVVSSLRECYPMHDAAQIGGVRTRIVQSLPDGEIADFVIDTNRTYRDPKDAHVHSAALHGNVNILLTNNVKDLRADELDELPYEVLTADQFLILVDDSSPTIVRQVTRQQFDYFRTRREAFSLPAALERAGAPEFAERVRQHLQDDHC